VSDPEIRKSTLLAGKKMGDGGEEGGEGILIPDKSKAL